MTPRWLEEVEEGVAAVVVPIPLLEVSDEFAGGGGVLAKTDWSAGWFQTAGYAPL